MYYACFHEKIRIQESPYLDAKTWSNIVLQACEIEPSLQNVAIAIGALGLTYTESSYGARRQSMIRGLNNKIEESELAQVDGATIRYQEAIDYYDKAIKQMREDIALGRLDLRTTLLTCIMIVCFESLHGNHEVARAQLQSGIALGHDWMSRQSGGSNYNPGYDSAALQINDSLAQVFVRLEFQVSSLIDRLPPPPEYHQALETAGNEVTMGVPNVFSSIKEARIYLEHILRRSSRFVDSICYLKASYTESYMAESTCGDGSEAYSAGNSPGIVQFDDQDRVFPEIQTSGIHDLSSRQDPNFLEQEAIVAEINSWITAFDPILDQSLVNGGINCVSALSLSTTMITARIAITTALSTSELMYDMLISDFRNVVSQSAAWLETLEGLKTRTDFCHTAFSLDLGNIPPLYVTMIKCRDSVIRHEAIQLLVSYPRREGEWDSAVVATFGEWIASIEEQNMQHGWISDERRIRDPSLDFNMMSVPRVAQMRCWKMNEEGEFELQERQIYW